MTDVESDFPLIISVDDHVVEPAHVWETLAARRSTATAAPRRAPRHRHDEARRRRHLRADLRSRRPEGRLLGLRGPRLHQQAPRRRGRLRPRRHDDVADHLRRDAPRLLRPEGPRRGHGHEPRRGVALLPDVPPLLRPDLHRGEGPRRSASPASRPTTTGWSRSGAATPAAASIPLIIVPLWDAELAAAEVRRNAERGVHAVCFSEIPAAPRAAVDPLRRLGPVLRGLRGDRDRRSTCTSGRRRACRPRRPTRRSRSRPRCRSTTRWRR